MDQRWIITRDGKGVVAAIEAFDFERAGLLVQRLGAKTGEARFGLYVPTLPRPTSILAGELIVRILEEQRVEIEAINCFEWVRPSLEQCIQTLR